MPKRTKRIPDLTAPQFNILSVVERILKYVIGGIVGGIIGYGVIMHIMNDPNQEACVSVISLSILLGIAISIALERHRAVLSVRENTEVRNETVALITHEMRTGMTSTGWVIQSILNDYDTDLAQKDKDMLKGVLDAIHVTVSHAVNLLDVSLLDIGRLAISLEWVKLGTIEKMFQDVVNTFEIGAKQRRITFKHEITLDKEKEVEVDKIRLRIILENLLENALQYTLGETKEMSAKISNDENNLMITISDTGIGIPDTEKENIFREFYRAKNARKVLVSGSGIGLYTCAQYVEAHNGTIRFESEEDAGTTFYITIPLKTVANVDEFLDKI